MHYRLPVAIAVLCIHAVIGSEDVAETDSETTNEESLHRVRRGLSMLRLGRGLQMLRLGKRALPMLRLGRSTTDSLSNDDLQYILSLMRSGRQVPLPRYGKDLAFQNMLMNALKNGDAGSELFDDAGSDFAYGYALDSAPERQIRPAPRAGRYRRSADNMDNAEEDEGKSALPRVVPVPRFGKDLDDRVAPLMRYGKESMYDDEDRDTMYEEEDTDANVVKRAMRMLRLGRGMRMLRLGKRVPDSEIDDDLTDVDKRALRLLRLGKRRPFAMLRLGRSGNDDEKRALRLLRLGKKSTSDV